MLTSRILLAAIFAAAMATTPAAAQDKPPAVGATVDNGGSSQVAPVEKVAAAAAEKEAAAKKAATDFQGLFQAEILAGGTRNDFRVPQPANRLGAIQTEIKWHPTGYEKDHRLCPLQPDQPPAPTKAASRDDPNISILGIWIPSPPCLWPITQRADVKITAVIDDAGTQKTLFVGSLPVSVLWLPLFVTFLVLLLIYPGGAAASWYVSQRRYKVDRERAGPDAQIPSPPSFWTALDPVELTKSSYGRGSIAKLQIFVFSFIVFGLLLFNVLRSGLLANMSTDVLYLMGISAAGAAGGKIAYMARRRLSLENWSWLRRKKWLPPEGDVAPRAKWGDLFTDSSTKEFDPYRFQMAVFSLVVAIALVKASATSLEAFQIPAAMLTLLGISHTVFVGGQAIDKSGFEEFDKKLNDVRRHENKYLELNAQVQAATQRAKAKGETYPPPADKDGKTSDGRLLANLPKPEDAIAELNAFKTDVAQAMEMFWSIYGPQLQEMSPELKNSSTMMPKSS